MFFTRKVKLPRLIKEADTTEAQKNEENVTLHCFFFCCCRPDLTGGLTRRVHSPHNYYNLLLPAAARGKPPPTKATRKQAKPQLSPSFSRQ